MKVVVLILVFVNFASCDFHVRIKRAITDVAEPNSWQPSKGFAASNTERVRVRPGLRDGPCPTINAPTPPNLMQRFATGKWQWEWYMDTDYGTLWTKDRLRCLYSELRVINGTFNSFVDYAIDSITNQQIVDRGQYKWTQIGPNLEMTSVIPGPYYRGLYFGTIGASGTNYYQYVASDRYLQDFIIWYSCTPVGDKHTAVGTISTRNTVTATTIASIAAALNKFPALSDLYYYRNDPNCALP